MIVIGSQALRIGLKKIGRLCRDSNDLDVFARRDEVRDAVNFMKLDLEKITPHKILCRASDGKHVEFEIAHPGTSTELCMNWAAEPAQFDQAEFYGLKMDVAPLEMLYSLKRSHRHSPRMFWKHVQDYALLREILKGEDIYSDITALRYKETVEREKLRTPSLNKSTVDFFDDNVSNRTFIHDQIHEVMAFDTRPMFEKIKIDPDKVACSKEKFFSLSERERIQCVQEEAYVIALERSMIPMLFEGQALANPYESYKWAVMRICTTLCSGWFREYALENHNTILHHYNKDYVHKFLKAVGDGKIKRIESLESKG
jgi:hypothetical protein